MSVSPTNIFLVAELIDSAVDSYDDYYEYYDDIDDFMSNDNSDVDTENMITCGGEYWFAE